MAIDPRPRKPAPPPRSPSAQTHPKPERPRFTARPAPRGPSPRADQDTFRPVSLRAQTPQPVFSHQPAPGAERTLQVDVSELLVVAEVSEVSDAIPSDARPSSKSRLAMSMLVVAGACAALLGVGALYTAIRDAQGTPSSGPAPAGSVPTTRDSGPSGIPSELPPLTGARAAMVRASAAPSPAASDAPAPSLTAAVVVVDEVLLVGPAPRASAPAANGGQQPPTRAADTSSATTSSATPSAASTAFGPASTNPRPPRGEVGRSQRASQAANSIISESLSQ